VRIFYVNVMEQNAGWGAEWFVNRAFHGLGHTTYCVDYRKNRYHMYKDFLDAPESDVFLLQRGDYFPIPLLESIQVPRFFWASELVSRCRDQDRLLKSGLFDHIFLHSHSCLETVVSRGWIDRDKSSVLLNGFDGTLHRPLSLDRDIDVLFVGSLTLRRESMLEEVQSHFNLVVASAFGEELVNLYNRAKIVLNIHAEDLLDTETRVFEALGCGAFLLTERLSQENPFSGSKLVEFNTVEDLCEKVQYYLTHEDERDEIAKRGHVAALRNHTYTRRGQEIVNTISSYLRENHREATVRRDWRLHAYGMSEPFLRLNESLTRKARHCLPRVRYPYLKRLFSRELVGEERK